MVPSDHSWSCHLWILSSVAGPTVKPSFTQREWIISSRSQRISIEKAWDRKQTMCGCRRKSTSVAHRAIAEGLFWKLRVTVQPKSHLGLETVITDCLIEMWGDFSPVYWIFFYSTFHLRCDQLYILCINYIILGLFNFPMIFNERNQHFLTFITEVSAYCLPT